MFDGAAFGWPRLFGSRRVKVVVCEKKEIHLTEGPQMAGTVLDLPDKLALRYLTQGAVERYETKVVREIPLADAGSAEPLSASPVAQASTDEMLITSELGDHREVVPPRKRGRPRKVS